jgi:hypothetical protein
MAQFAMTAPKPLPLLRLEPFRGLDTSGTNIDNHHSPDVLNMNLSDKGALNKRTGYAKVFSTSLGSGKINGLYMYTKSNGTTYFLIAHDTTLYKQSGSDQPVSITAG